MWATLQLLRYISSGFSGPSQVYAAQSCSLNSLGPRSLRRPGQDWAPQGARGTSTCLRPHTQVPRLPLALISKAGSLLGGVRAATQAEETPTCSMSPFAHWPPGCEGAQDPERRRPGPAGAALLTARRPRGRWGPSAVGPRTLVSPIREPLKRSGSREDASWWSEAFTWGLNTAVSPPKPASERSDLWIGTARSESENPLNAGGQSRPAGAPTGPLSLWGISVSLAETHRDL